MKKLLFILFSITILSSISSSQVLIHVKGKYSHGDKTLTKKDFVKILKSSQIANEYYQRSQKQKNWAMALGLTSVAAIVGGGTLLLYDLDKNYFARGISKDFKGGVASIIGGCISGTIAIFLKVRSKKSFKKSIQVYNKKTKTDISEEYKIDISILGNSGGITYSF